MFLITLPTEPAAVPTCVCMHNNNRVSRPRHALPHAARVRVPVATPVDSGHWTGRGILHVHVRRAGENALASHPPGLEGPRS